MEMNKNGTVKWFNDKKGYGFITDVDGNDIFVHYSGIMMHGHRTLKQGTEVKFDIYDYDKKGNKAVNVVIPRKHKERKIITIDELEKIMSAEKRIFDAYSTENYNFSIDMVCTDAQFYKGVDGIFAFTLRNRSFSNINIETRLIYQIRVDEDGILTIVFESELPNLEIKYRD